jgi:L-asparagine transporter-like permease
MAIILALLIPLLLFLSAVLAIFAFMADPVMWVSILTIAFGVFICCGYFFFRDVWREWRAERRSRQS